MRIQPVQRSQVSNIRNQQNFTGLYITPKGMAKLSKMFLENSESSVKFNKYIAGPLKNIETQVLFDGFTAQVQVYEGAGKYRYLNPCPPFVKVNSPKCGYRDEGWQKEIKLSSDIMPKIKKGKENMDDFRMLAELEQARCIAEHFELKNGRKLNRTEVKPIDSYNFESCMKDLYSKYNGTYFKELSEEKIEDLRKWAYNEKIYTRPSKSSSYVPDIPTTHEDMLAVFLGGI